MIPFTSSSVDKAYLRFIFNEDLYLIKEKNRISEAEISISSVQESPVVPISANNHKNGSFKIGIVVESEKEVTDYKDFLTKILQAVNVSWEEAGIISKNNLNENLSFESYLIFGLAPQSFIHFKAPILFNQVLKEDLKKFIFTYSLSELEKNKDKKKGLWGAMQEAYLK